MNTNHNNTSFTPNKLWSTPLGHPPTASPTTTGDLLLIPTHQPNSASQTAALHALDLSDGSPRWQQSFDHAMITGLLPLPHKQSDAPPLPLSSAPLLLLTLTSTNVIHGQGALLALDAAGQEHARWSPGVQRVSAPAVSGDVVCLTADARSLILLDLPTCQEQARIPLETTASLSAPALAGGIAYIPCRGPHLLAVPLPPQYGGDARGGWRFESPDTAAWLDKTPVLVGDHLFTVLSIGAALTLCTGDGAQVWRVDLGPGGKRVSAPTTDGQHLYIGARDGLHALNLADGREAWAFPTSRRIEAAPVVTGGVVYVACHDHHAYALDAATGRELWRYELGQRRIEHSPVLATCGETPCLLVADRSGALTAIARPLSAQEHEAAAHWTEAASAYAALGQPARAAQLLEAHGEPLKAAQLWQTAGEPERAAQQYEAAEAWQQAAQLWAALDRPLKRAAALEAHARALEETTCSADKCAQAWEIAAQTFDAGGNIERAAACRIELARCLELPIITVDVQLDNGLVLDAWSLLRFIVRNEGYGPARNLVIRASGDQFKGQVMHTQRIVTLRADREYAAVLDVCPREPGDSVPLRVRAEYHDRAGELCFHEDTIYIAVARTAATRGEGQVINVFVSGSGAAAVGTGAVVAGAGGVAVGRDAGGDIAIEHTDDAHSPTTAKSSHESVSTSGGEMIKILFLAANPTDTTRLRLGEESRAIDQALRQAEFRDKFDIEQHWAVRAADLQGYLLRHQPHIVHFSGHGGPSSEIILEDNAGNSHPVSVRALSTLFSVLKDNVRCVVLNACFSEQQARAIAQHIDCVIGMSTAIGDAAAISFATAFYQALGYGRDVKTAFDLGCVQIDLANLEEQDTPQLLTVKADPSKIQFVRND